LDTLTSVAAFIAIAAITPGPNNLFVLTIAAEQGWRAAAAAIAGVVAGGIALLAAISAGAGALFAAVPSLRVVLGVAGCAYLIWLGVKSMLQAWRPRRSAPSPANTFASRSFVGMALFQWLNPKGWLLLLTAVSAVGQGWQGWPAFVVLAVMFGLISTLCLIAWALLGAAMTSALRRPAAARAFDFTMGALLVASVVPLLPR
jgi:threonine/homoserine/homoserine lactone efflux protein